MNCAQIRSHNATGQSAGSIEADERGLADTALILKHKGYLPPLGTVDSGEDHSTLNPVNHGVPPLGKIASDVEISMSLNESQATLPSIIAKVNA